MKKTALILLALLSSLATANAQEKHSTDDVKVWKLSFQLEETSAGKEVSLRNYTMTIGTLGPNGTVRTGDKVPVSTKDGLWTFVDVGVNIDCRLAHQADGVVYLAVTADISGVAGTSAPPLINQTKWNGEVKAPVGKTTTVFTADGSTTRRSVKLEVTVRPVE